MPNPPITSSIPFTYTPEDNRNNNTCAGRQTPLLQHNAKHSNSPNEAQASCVAQNNTNLADQQALMAFLQAQSTHPQQPLTQRFQPGLQPATISKTLSTVKLQHEHQMQLQKIVLKEKTLSQKIESLRLHVKQVQTQKQRMELMQTEENSPPPGQDQIQLQKFWSQKLCQRNSGEQLK